MRLLVIILSKIYSLHATVLGSRRQVWLWYKRNFDISGFYYISFWNAVLFGYLPLLTEYFQNCDDAAISWLNCFNAVLISLLLVSYNSVKDLFFACHSAAFSIRHIHINWYWMNHFDSDCYVFFSNSLLKTLEHHTDVLRVARNFIWKPVTTLFIWVWNCDEEPEG